MADSRPGGAWSRIAQPPNPSTDLHRCRGEQHHGANGAIFTARRSTSPGRSSGASEVALAKTGFRDAARGMGSIA